MAASSNAPQDRRSARAPAQAPVPKTRDIPVANLLNSREAVVEAGLPEWLAEHVHARQGALTKLNSGSEHLGFDLVLRVGGAQCMLAALPKPEGVARDQMPMGAPVRPDEKSPLHEPIKHLIHCFQTVLIEREGQEQLEARRHAGREHHRLATAVGAQTVNARSVLNPAPNIPTLRASTEPASARKAPRM